MSQIPINIGDSTYNPLLPFGFGIVSPADFNGDGKVDLADLMIFCDSWLKVPGNTGYDSRANLYGDPSGIVNFDDFAVLANEWNPYSAP